MNTAIETASIWQSYRSSGDRFDEMLFPDGTTRPHWRFLKSQLQQLGAAGLTECSATMERLVRENGTTFRVDDGEKKAGSSRPWQVSPIPMVFEPRQWQDLSAGLAQRTILLETILQDLLGPQRLIREGILPGRLLWENPNFYRTYHELDRNSQKLHLTATDLARRSDGQWIVTGDRTRAPSGLGYLLENRIVTSRVFPQLIRSCKTLRCASFFESLREHLRSQAKTQRDNPRVVLMTPPGASYREFEDAYLARYLGMMLVQGSDLAVRGGQLNLKTLGGLLPLQVVWRHVSDRSCDPLELAPDSSSGVSGMLRCVRNQQVAVVNTLGSVLVQTPALMAYLDAANQYFFSEPLTLKSAKVYWCGDDKDRKYVLDHLDDLIVRPAFAVSSDPPYVVSEMSQEDRGKLRGRITASPRDFIAQERFQYSTTPVWTSGGIQSQCVSLRTFQLLRGENVDDERVRVLPGALTRVGKDDLELAWSPVSGNMTQDCWVMSEKPVEHQITLLKESHGSIQIRRAGDELPSRVAEHLYWLGRYSERAEALARLLRTTLDRISGEDEIKSVSEIPRLVYALASMGQVEPSFALESFAANLPELEIVLPRSITDVDQPRGLQRTMQSVVHNATAVRDRLSMDAYRIVQRAQRELNAPLGPDNIGQAIERMGTLIVDLLSFAGIVTEGFVRTHAWQFLELGRRIERADHTADLLLTMLCPATPNGSRIHEAVLQVTDSSMTYRSRYLNLVRLAPVIDLVAVDETNPRSIRYQLDEIVQLLKRLPSGEQEIGPGPDERIAMNMHHQLIMAEPHHLCHLSESGELDRLRALMTMVKEEIPKLAQAVNARYLIHTQTVQQITGAR
ncbi:circularly permuted type 2 ATP-grasp protein [Stieleria varia]|uniref:circularly permuted type 2 ATP-grasp protein n=1 Tax=Stieleria varia TaxID=2528005 RepID=UPI001E5B8985|nr:circularly permuted type 2 ATP-grasp protein [Stieleria varia]